MSHGIPGSYVYEDSVKASFCFAITVIHTDIPKEHVFCSLEEFCDAILVAQEKNHIPSSWHHHIYMRTTERYHIEEIFTFVQEAYNNPSGDHINVRTVRDTKKLLKYITKMDHEPLFKGLSDKEFHFSYSGIRGKNH